jgi:hypothetical protein
LEMTMRGRIAVAMFMLSAGFVVVLLFATLP